MIKETKMNEKAILKALYRKALGYEYCETTSEYQLVDGELQEIKRRVVTRENSPDVSAAKLLLEFKTEQETPLSEEEIQREKLRLIRLLLEKENAN